MRRFWKSFSAQSCSLARSCTSSRCSDIYINTPIRPRQFPSAKKTLLLTFHIIPKIKKPTSVPLRPSTTDWLSAKPSWPPSPQDLAALRFRLLSLKTARNGSQVHSVETFVSSCSRLAELATTVCSFRSKYINTFTTYSRSPGHFETTFGCHNSVILQDSYQ